RTGCVSCHHNSLVAMSVATARANGYTVNETTAKTQSRVVGAYLDTWRARTLQNHFIAGAQDTISYLLFGLAVENYPPDAATEERAFRLLGLSWAHAPQEIIRTAARELMTTQRADGGWTQLDERQLTDAYATGEALVALRESGAVEATDPAYRRGVEYLLRTQIADGSWFVESRAEPIQAAFASGFPYGPHQWVSA